MACSVNAVNRVWSWQADRHGWSAQMNLLGCGSRKIILPLQVLSGSSEAATALSIHSVLLLKVAVLKNACADIQFANQVEDIHICRDFQLDIIKPPQMRRKK